MVIAIFRSRLRPEYVEEYRSVAPKVLELAQSMPGFTSFKTFTSDDGERVSIIEFESLDHLQAWRDHPEHKKAQQLGRDRYYAEYHIQICNLIRAYSFKDEGEQQNDLSPSPAPASQ